MARKAVDKEAKEATAVEAVEVADKYKDHSSFIVKGVTINIEDGKVKVDEHKKKILSEGGFLK